MPLESAVRRTSRSHLQKICRTHLERVERGRRARPRLSDVLAVGGIVIFFVTRHCVRDYRCLDALRALDVRQKPRESEISSRRWSVDRGISARHQRVKWALIATRKPVTLGTPLSELGTHPINSPKPAISINTVSPWQVWNGETTSGHRRRHHFGLNAIWNRVPVMINLTMSRKFQNHIHHRFSAICNGSPHPTGYKFAQPALSSQNPRDYLRSSCSS
jgi:hypothetical protein